MNSQEFETPPAQRILGEILNLSDGAYIGVEYTDVGLGQVAYDISVNPFIVEVTPKRPFELGLGTVTDQILIAACEDPECTKHLPGSPVEVDVTYTVQTRFSPELNFSSISLVQVLGSNVQATGAMYFNSMFPLSWRATSNQSWLQIHRTSGTTPSSLRVGVNRDELPRLSLGSYQGEVTVSNPQAQVEDLVVPVKLQVVAPSLSVSSSVMAFGGADGWDLAPKTLNLSLNTESAAYAWTATIDTGEGPRWLSLSSTSGTVSANATPLTFSVDPTGLPSGLHTAQVTFTTSVQGLTLTKTVPVSLSLVAHKLWLSDDGVGLVSTPSASKLTHTVKVKDSTGQLAAAWTASSSQPWLSATPSGGNTLTVTASPAGLAADTLHLATVTVTAQDSSLGSSTLQVGLWVGSSASNSRDTLTASYWGLVMDPIRPYAYLHDRTNLDVYNVYTASRVARLPALGSSLHAMTISTDGSTLYVEEQGNQIIPVDLRTLTAGRPWLSSSPTRIIGALAYARPSGEGLVFSASGQVYDAARGFSVSVSGEYEGWRNNVFTLAASVDGSVLCGSGSRLFCHDMRYRRSNLNGSLSLTPRGVNEVYHLYTALKEDGSRLYASPYLRFRFSAYDTRGLSTFLQWGEDTYPDDLAVSVDDRLYGVAYAANGPKDVRVFDDAGTSLGSYRVATASQSVVALAVSGDGKRFVTVINSSAVEFISAP